MGPRGLGSLDEAHAEPMSVASTNFLASAEVVAAHFAEAVLIDMGSTTPDIIPIVNGRPGPRGLTDGERLATGELVYSGLTRTDVSNVARTAKFRGHKQRLAAGGFATMADVRRILGELPDGIDQHETADKRGKSLPESLARFARSRCFGRDRIDADLQDWREAATIVEFKQMEEIRMAFALARGLTPVEIEGPIVAAGIGAWRIVALMQHDRLPTHLFGDVVDAADDCREWATRCAPAVAVALLCEGN
jgi:probable H4MPT-linked C1 transfer pathway protein